MDTRHFNPAELSVGELAELIEYHNHRYWELGEPEIPDERYDELLRALARLAPALICVVIIAILSLGAYTIYQDSFIRELAGSRTDVLRQIAERSRQFKISLYTLSNLFESSPAFRRYAEELNADNQEEFFVLMDTTTRQMEAAFLQPDLDFYVVYISPL